MKKTCENCDYYNTDRNDQPCCTCVNSLNYEGKQRQIDRIRNMSVEELVILLDTCDNELPPYCKHHNTCDGRCLSCAKEWLESEVDTE